MNEETTQSDTSIAMPCRPGWYLVEVAGLARQPESGFMVDYCREASPTDGGGMQWIDNYCHTVVAWYPLPKRTRPSINALELTCSYQRNSNQ